MMDEQELLEKMPSNEITDIEDIPDQTLVPDMEEVQDGECE